MLVPFAVSLDAATSALLVAMFVIPAALLVALIAVIAVRDRRYKAMLKARLDAVAPSYQGEVKPGGYVARPSLSFPHEGAAVRLMYEKVGGKAPTLTTDILVTYPGCTPTLTLSVEGPLSDLAKRLGVQDIVLGVPEFDAAWLVRGDAQSAPGLLDEDVRRALGALRVSPWKHTIVTTERAGEQTRLRFRTLEWTTQEAAIHQHLQLCLDIAGALRAARIGPWRAVAEARGLTLEEVQGLPRLTGELSRSPVEVRVERASSGWVTVVHAGIQGPPGLHLIHADKANGGARRLLGDPALDGAIAVFGDDDTVRALFADGARTTAVLEVVHAHPGSTVTDQAVTLRSAGWALDTLPGLLDRVDALLQALPEAAA